MKVLDHEPWCWFLVADEERLLLDVNCNHSAFGYSWLIELNPSEVGRYRKAGRDYITQLADLIQYSAPAVKGSTSPFIDRKLGKEQADAVHRTIMKWRSDQDS